MSAPMLRIATASDVAGIHRLLLDAESWLAERGIPMWLPVELLIDPIRNDVAAGMHLVAEIDGELAGTLRFQLEDALFWPDLPPGGSAFVHRLAVDRRFAGQGVSTALLGWAVNRARELDREFLRLDCDAARPRLRAFYERFGFRHHSDRQVGPYFVARYEMRVNP